MTDNQGITVSLWLSTQIATTTADSEGNFALRDILPGVYELRIESSAGEGTRRQDVTAETGKVTFVGLINLYNLVWPIVSVSPVEGTTAEATVDISFTSKTRISMQTALSGVTITPNLSGSWNEYIYSSGSYVYSFTPDGDLSAGQQYSVTIPSNLEFTDGVTLGHSITNTFMVEPFAITYSQLHSGSDGIDPETSYPLLTLRFSHRPDSTSMEENISIVPTVDLDITRQALPY